MNHSSIEIRNLQIYVVKYFYLNTKQLSFCFTEAIPNSNSVYILAKQSLI